MRPRGVPGIPLGVPHEGRPSRFIVALRWPIALGWIAGAVAAWLLLPGLGSGSGPMDDIVPSGASAITAQARAAQLFGSPAGSDVAVVQQRSTGLTTADVSAHARGAAVETGRRAEGLLGVLPLVNQPLPGLRWNQQRTTALDVLFVDPGVSLDDRTALAHAHADALGRPAGVTGAGPARLAQFSHIEDELPWITAGTIAVILLVTGLYFRAMAAPLVTLVSAGIAYVVAVRAAGWLSERVGVDTPREIEPVLVVLLLGLATDYSVFLLADARRRMLAGADARDAARGCLRRIGPTVLTAGAIVAACSAALLAGRLDFFRVFGPGMALCALVVTLVTVTLVPAIVALAGPRLFGRDVRAAEDTATGPTPADAPAPRLPRFLAARPVALVVAALATAGLGWAALQAREVHLGVDPIGALPASDPVHRAGQDARQGFAGGILAPAEIVLEAPGIGRDDAALERLRASVGGFRGVAGAVGPRLGDVVAGATGARNPMLSADRDAARIVAVLDRDPTGAQGLTDLRRLRAALPGLVRDAGLPADTQIALAGEAALASETVDAVKDDALRVGIAIAVVTALLLVVFLRALVAPLLLVAAGGLGFLASLGLTSLLVREVAGDDGLTFFVPLVAGVLLLALGSDYNVLVAGRVRAESERRRARDAVAVAVPQASLAITAAAVTLAASFALLALVPLRPFRELAALLCIGVLVDALVVRSVLVPSLLSLAGERAWWPSTVRAGSRASAAPPSCSPAAPS